QRHQSELHAIARLKIHHGKLEAEGQGIGRALLQAGEDWARANRYSKLTLAVFKDNERAKQVYERQGWPSELETWYKPLVLTVVAPTDARTVGLPAVTS